MKTTAVLVLTLAGAIPICAPASFAAVLYSEPFDAAASAKITMNNGVDTEVVYVDYSNFTIGATTFPLATVPIPEAPRQVVGSAATRGILLRQKYTGTDRILNLFAADAVPPAGVARIFTGNYRVRFDAWLNLDPSTIRSSAGTTEALIFGVGYSGAAKLGRTFRSSGVGTWGWLAADCGFGTTANSGDANLRIGGVQFGQIDETSPVFTQAFATPNPSAPLTPCPNNQWTRVDIDVAGGLLTLSFNGVKFWENVPTSATDGQVVVGYEDPFTGSNNFSPDHAWCLIDNLVVEDTLPPTMLVAQLAAPPTFTGLPTVGSFSVENRQASNSLTISAVSFSGAGASAFSVASPLPLVIPAGNASALAVVFNPSAPNGIKTASMTITSDDPQQPSYVVPIVQGRRTVAPADLLAHYKLDEASGTSLADSSGQNANATLTIRAGSPVTYSLPSLLPPGSPAGTALGMLPAQTSAEGNYANSPALHTPTVSISCWVQPESTGATRTLFNRDPDFDTQQDEIYSLVISSTGEVLFIVNGVTVLQTPVVVPNDETAHIVLTHRDDDGFGNATAARSRLYVNGLLQAESNAPVGFDDYPLSIAAPTMYVGTKSVAGRGFKGRIDDIQIYSRELTGWQVAGLFDRGGSILGDLTQPEYRMRAIQANQAVQPATLAMSWSSYPGDSYTLESSTDLLQWTPLQGFAGDSFSRTTFATIPLPADPKHFYRVRLVPAP